MSQQGSEQVSVREQGGVALPPAGTYVLDQAHTEIGFVARHMLARVRGRFTSFDGRIEIAERPEDSGAEVEIDAGSIWTNQEMRDNHLRSGDFFDVGRFPRITFRSRGLRPTGPTTFQLVGNLTIKDVTREVLLDVEYLGFGSTLQGDAMVAFSARGEVDREDWGLTWNQVLETGGLLVGKKVQIDIEVEAIRSEDQGA